MSKSKISDIRYYSEHTPEVEYCTNDNLLGSCCSEIFMFLISFIFIGPLIIVIALMWLVYKVLFWIYKLYKWIFQKKKSFYENIGRDMTYEEVRWINEINTSMISVLFLDQPIEIAELKSVIIDRIFNFKLNSKKSHNFCKRFRQNSKKIDSIWKWVEDSDFNLDNHVLSLAPISNSLSNILVEVTNQTYNVSHPLWNLFLINSSISLNKEETNGFNENINEEQTAFSKSVKPNSTIVLKIHPSLTDGISLMRVLTELINDKPEPSTFKINKLRRNLFLKVFNAIFYSIVLFFKSWYFKKSQPNIFKNSSTDNENQFNDSSKSQFIFCNFSLNEINRLKLITRSTMGEIMLSLLTSGIRHHHHVLSKTVNIRDCPCLITIDMSSSSNRVNNICKIKNNMSFYDVELPLSTEGMLPILWTVKQRMKIFKSCSDYIFLYLFPKMVSSIFSLTMTEKMMTSYYKKSELLFSSFNNKLKPISINGKKSNNILFWFPLFGLISISMACFSYDNQFTICLRGRDSRFVNLQILLNAIKYQVRHMGKLLENRRIPGDIAENINSDNYIFGPNQRISVSTLTTNQILNMLNDIQIKIQNESKHTNVEIEKMKLNFSILFSALKDKKRNTESFVDFDEDLEEPKYTINRRFSLPSMTKVVQKDSLRRLSFSKNDFKMTEIVEKISEDPEANI